MRPQNRSKFVRGQLRSFASSKKKIRGQKAYSLFSGPLLLIKVNFNFRYADKGDDRWGRSNPAHSQVAFGEESSRVPK